MAEDSREWNILGRRLFAAKGFIIGSMLVTSLLAALYCLLTPPVYQADALLQIESPKNDIFGTSEIATLLGSASSSAAEIEILKSRTILAKAIESLGLDVAIVPQRLPLIGDAVARLLARDDSLVAPLLGLTSYDWGGSRLAIAALEVPEALLYQPLRLVAQDAGSFRLYHEDDVLLQGRVGERVAGQGVVIQVSELRANPRMTFQVTKVPTLFAALDLQVQLDVTEKGKDTGVLNASLQGTDVALTKATLQRIISLYLEQNRARVSADAAASLSFIKNQLPTVKAELDQAANRLDSYQRSEGSINIDLETKALLDQLVALEAELTGLRLKQSDLERLYTTSHPALRTLQNQIAVVQARKQQLLGQTRILPNTQKDLFGLTRDVQVASETYSQLLNRAQELSVLQAGSVGNVRILDNADVDEREPVKPRTLLILAAGALFGLVVAVGLCVLRFTFRPTLTSADCLIGYGWPVLSVIPYSAAEKRLRRQPLRAAGRGGLTPAVLAEHAPQEGAVEALRSLRTNLHILGKQATNNVVLITGATPAVGKTFVSVNFATVIARTGKRVLLIDGDLRRGQLHHLLGVAPMPGLADALVDRLDPISCVLPTAINNLFVLPGGSRKGLGSEILAGDGLSHLLACVSNCYDMVIIDSPPLLVATDGALLAEQSSLTFVVARLGVTTLRELDQALQSLGNLGIAAAGFVLNASTKGFQEGYHYASYYDIQPQA